MIFSRTDVDTGRVLFESDFRTYEYRLPKDRTAHAGLLHFAIGKPRYRRAGNLLRMFARKRARRTARTRKNNLFCFPTVLASHDGD